VANQRENHRLKSWDCGTVNVTSAQWRSMLRHYKEKHESKDSPLQRGGRLLGNVANRPRCVTGYTSRGKALSGMNANRKICREK
jgi:hypothetical protein